VNLSQTAARMTVIFPRRKWIRRLSLREERVTLYAGNTLNASVMWVSFVSGVTIKTQSFWWRGTYI
jgi:hypothetical protein